jgi:LAO/AO transport system kinase
VLDAAGKDVIVIETVGVGQAEVDVASTADVSIVLLVPGTGDEIQALKAGLMEIADIFVVNQADREGADKLVQAIAANQALKPATANEWRPPILKTVATTGEGVAELWAAIGQFLAQSASTTTARRRQRQAYRLRELLSQQFLEQLEQTLPAGHLDRLIERIAARDLDPYTAARDLLAGAHK